MGILEGDSTAEIDASIETVWALVADVEHGPDWQAGLRSLASLERDPDGHVLLADTETDAKLRVIKSRVRFTYEAPIRLSWDQTQGDIKSVRGSWELEQLDEDRTRATYRAAVDLGRLGILLRGPIIDVLRGQLAGARAKELKAAIERGQ